MKITLNVNGKTLTLNVDDAQMPLLYALRDDLGLHRPRSAAASGNAAHARCWSTAAVRSCVSPIATLAGKKIVTLEGLGTPGKPHPLQAAFIDRPNEKPWGAGEPTAAIVPATIANAIHNATGARLRSVPFSPEKVLAALKVT